MSRGQLNLKMLRAMRHSAVQNYIIPGLVSHLIGERTPQGCVRLFESTREQQTDITPHSHRFDFQCLVLNGRVLNRVWTPSTDGDMFTMTKTAFRDMGQYETESVGNRRFVGTDEVYEKGDWYAMRSEQIHSIFFSRDTEVLFFEGPTLCDHSVILEPFCFGERVPTFETRPWMFTKPQETGSAP